ncbi:MAG: hypothetical protein M3347_00030, partial [Armatimonadota bacterium]|nr:hypothetical protein [Armatimonadota bacterium]
TNATATSKFVEPAIDLARPLDFSLIIRKATVSVTQGKFTKFVMEDADLVLPIIANEAAAGASQEAAKIKLPPNQDMMKEFVVKVPQPLKLFFADGYMLEATNYTVDLSPTGPADAATSQPGIGNKAWLGVFMNQARVHLQGATAANAQNFYVDGFGVTGLATINQPISIGSYTVTGIDAKVQFKRNELTEGGEYDGKLKLGELGELSVRGSLSSIISSLTVDENQTLAHKNLGLEMSIAAGSIAYRDNDYRLLLTGVLDFPGVAELKSAEGAFQFKDLGIQHDGKFYLAGNWMTLTHPAHLDLGIFTLNATQLGFEDPNAVAITGAMKLATDIPLTDEIQFQGMKVVAGAPPKLHVNPVFLDFEVPSIANINGQINYGAEANGTSYLGGDVKLKLLFAGDSEDIGGALKFKVAKGAWYVLGVASLGDTARIPLGTTGLNIYGFQGGFGHNIRSDPPGAVGVPARDYQLVLDPSQNNWLFVAGVRVGTDDKYTLWGDAVLTVITDPFFINLNGEVYLLTDWTPVGQQPEAPNNYGTADITYDSGASSFRAAVAAHIYYPNRSTTMVEAHGNLELLLSPDEQHLFIGWPIDQRPIIIKVLNGYEVSGGAAIALKPQKMIGAGIMWRQTFLGIVNGQIDGVVTASFDGNLMPTVLEGQLHAYGGVDFYVFSASAEAWVNGTFDVSEPSVYVNGQFRGCIETFFGDVCKNVGFSGKLP